MATYYASAEMGPPTALPLQEQVEDTLASDLNMYTIVENDDMRHGDDGRWSVNIINAEGQIADVPAPQGLIIRYADSRDRHASYSYINAEGRRVMLDTNQQLYPAEVGGRLLSVQQHRTANGLGYEDPLGMKIPEALIPQINEGERDASYEAPHSRESRMWSWARKAGRFLRRHFGTESDLAAETSAAAPAAEGRRTQTTTARKPEPQPATAPFSSPAENRSGYHNRSDAAPTSAPAAEARQTQPTTASGPQEGLRIPSYVTEQRHNPAPAAPAAEAEPSPISRPSPDLQDTFDHQRTARPHTTEFATPQQESDWYDVTSFLGLGGIATYELAHRYAAEVQLLATQLGALSNQGSQAASEALRSVRSVADRAGIRLTV